MDLQGKIEKFNVPEIFQLIASGKRTGTLGIIRNDQATMFYFKGGQITYAYLPGNRQRIGERLVNKGFINNRVLDAALAMQKENRGKNRIGKILVEQKRINEQQLATILTEQISDIVYKVMSWDKGLFKFYDDKFPTSEDESISLSTESLILDGLKRTDELNNLKKQLPDFNSGLTWKPVSDNTRIDLSLSANEWNILRLCNGSRTIDDIINSITDDTAEILTILHKLLKQKIIEPSPTGTSQTEDLTHLELQIDALAGLLNQYLNKS